MLLAMLRKVVNINITKTINDATFDAPILLVDMINKSFNKVTSKFETCLKSAVNVDLGLVAGFLQALSIQFDVIDLPLRLFRIRFIDR